MLGGCTLAVALASLVGVVLVGFSKCDGDGGVPYSARDSVAGRFCDGPLFGVWAGALLVVPAVALLLVGVRAVARGRWLWIGVAAAIGAGTVLSLTVPALALPGKCSDEDQRAYDEWVASGRAGPRPADCERY